MRSFKIWFLKTNRGNTKRDVIFRENDHYEELSKKTEQDDQSQLLGFQEKSEAELFKNRQLHAQVMDDSSTDEKESENGKSFESVDRSFEPEHRDREV